MSTSVPRPRSLCNLSAEELDQLNDIHHRIGCGCPECRPDLHDELERCPVAHEGFGSPEAA